MNLSSKVDAVRFPVLDVAFLQAWSPARFAVLGLIIWAVLCTVSPLEYELSKFSMEATIYAVVSLIAFFSGCQIAKTFNSRPPATAVQPTLLPADRLINITIGLGFVGVAARFYDRVIVRGFTLETTLIESRESISESLSPFAYLGGILFSFGLIALMLMWVSGAYQRRRYAFVVAMFLAAYPMLETIVQGSRSTTIHAIFLLYMCARSSNAMRWLVRSPPLLIAGGCLVIVGAQVVYELRSLQGVDERDIIDVFEYTAISEYARPQQWMVRLLVETNAQGLFGGALKVWTHLTQYLTHSWLVYFDNYDSFDGIIGWGRLHLFMPFRILSAITGEDLNYDATMHGMTLGVSTTAFSSLYYDFAAAGPLVAGVFGYVATRIQKKAIMMPERWLPVHIYLCFTCLMMMVDNQLIGGLGAFAIWTFSGYVFLHYLVTLLSGSIEVKEPDPLPIALAQPALRQQ